MRSLMSRIDNADCFFTLLKISGKITSVLKDYLFSDQGLYAPFSFVRK